MRVLGDEGAREGDVGPGVGRGGEEVGKGAGGGGVVCGGDEVKFEVRDAEIGLFCVSL